MSVPAECRLCPRQCRAHREAGEAGRCGADSQVCVALADLHPWEEPCLSGENGAGAVFFSGCPLGCVFCQNRAISRGGAGRTADVGELAEMFLSLQERGAACLDLVTGTPYIPQIVRSVRAARRKGLTVPVVWNSSAYETAASLRLLEGTVDVYLPDFKYWSEETAARYAKAPGYRRTAKLAVAEMIRQKPACELSPSGVLTSGVLIRHLLLPGGYREADRILRYLDAAAGGAVWLSLMRQYTPMPGLDAYPELRREVSDDEYGRIVRLAQELDFDVVYAQEAGCASLRYVPAFGS